MVARPAGKSAAEIRGYLKTWGKRNHIVFYLEEMADWGFLQDIFKETREIAPSNVVILKSFKQLVQNFADEYYVGKGLTRVFLFRTLPAKILVTTMTDIGNLGLNRSINDTKYVYTFHSLASINAVYLEGAFDNYDYIFACHNTHVEELVERREASASRFKIFRGGYPRLDRVRQEIAIQTKMESGKVSPFKQGRKNVLIAPTWGPSAVTPLQIKQIYQGLHSHYNLTLRLHPMITTRKSGRSYLSEISKLESPDFRVKTDVSLVSDFVNSDVLITDWSGTALEFSYGTGRPTISVDTPQKIRNVNFQDVAQTLEFKVRRDIGVVLGTDSLSDIKLVVDKLLESENLRDNSKSIEKLSQEIFNSGIAAKLIAEAILSIFEDRESSNFWI